MYAKLGQQNYKLMQFFDKHVAHAKPSFRKLGHWDYVVTVGITRKRLNTA